jgi:hypothetical protein
MQNRRPSVLTHTPGWQRRRCPCLGSSWLLEPQPTPHGQGVAQIGLDLPGGHPVPERRPQLRLLPTVLGHGRQPRRRRRLSQPPQSVEPWALMVSIHRPGAVRPQKLHIIPLGGAPVPLGHQAAPPALLPGLALRGATLRPVDSPRLAESCPVLPFAQPRLGSRGG